jgi:hypothetical protein
MLCGHQDGTGDIQAALAQPHDQLPDQDLVLRRSLDQRQRTLEPRETTRSDYVRCGLTRQGLAHQRNMNAQVRDLGIHGWTLGEHTTTQKRR